MFTIKQGLLLFSLAISFIFQAQNASITGKITDASNNEPVFYAKVMLQGLTKGALSDIEGNYTITNLTPGTYAIEVRLGSYNTVVLTDIKLKSGETKTVNITMESVTKSLGPVTITKTVNKESVSNLLQIQKSSLVVLDGIPAELIKKSPDRTVGDALKRVSGASIQDNKFAVIRGLNDRYNAAYLNGAPLPSSEADRKAFAFDIFPVNMLDNLTIVKTASPDLPAEFAGGIIQIKTKDIPAENFQSISIGGGYNTVTTFKNKSYSDNGKLAWLGLNDGTRSISSEIPSFKNYPTTINEEAALAKKFNVDWKLNENKFMPNFNLQYAGGFKKVIKEKSEFGFIGSLSYNRTNNFNVTERKSYGDNTASAAIPSLVETNYLDKVYSNQTLAGAMINLAYKINAGNSLNFKNVYSINSDSRIINRTGEINPLDNNPVMIRSNANWMTTNQIYSGQIGGQHALKEGIVKLDWTGAFSNILRTVPNLRRSIYTRLKNVSDPTDPNPLDTTFVANIAQSNVGPDYGGSMFFSSNKESIYSFKANAAFQLKETKTAKTELKIGVFTQFRNREFAARQLGYTRYGVSGGNVNFNQQLLYQSEDSIFRPENMGLISPGVGGFKLSDGTKNSDSYNANSNLYAGYFSFLHTINNLKLLYGLRVEDFTQNLTALRADKSELNLRQHNLDFLPSLNAIYSATKNQNLRFSASQTLNRPEYRELAPFAFYDFNTQFVLSGNDSLKRAKITNADLRYEYFSGNGQMFSATVFYKYFSNPIEQIARPDVLNEITYKNVPNAVNYGIELEVKTNFGSLFKADSSSLWNKLIVYTNLGLIHSVVDVSNNVGTQYQTRPLQGQSPYVFNCGLNHQTESNLSFSLNVNRVGSRIYILGSVLQPDIWEKSRTFLDFQVAKTFLNNKLEVKFNIQNILAQNLVFYQNKYGAAASRNIFNKATDYLFTGDATGESRYNKADDIVWSTKLGQTFSFVITYKF